MTRPLLKAVAELPLAARPRERGWHVVYHDDTVNHCPGCGRSSWYIGRSTAECNFCGTAIPLADRAA